LLLPVDSRVLAVSRVRAADGPLEEMNGRRAVNMATEFAGTKKAYRAGVEDLIIVPLVGIGLTLRLLAQATLLVLVRILDFSFPLVMQLVRLPLFLARIMGDAVIAAASGMLKLLPIAESNRQDWRAYIAEKWHFLRDKISYKAFEEAVHHAFEGGMEWVFRKCRHLTPNTALSVIAGAILWLPASLIIATGIHALLIAYATVLPAWMQLLHPLATIIAKSKLLVVPVYPAAWPQAKRHPLVQNLKKGYRLFTSLHVAQKTRHRYHQSELVLQNAADSIALFASAVGLTAAWETLRTALAAMTGSIVRPLQRAMSSSVAYLSEVRLIGPAIKNCASQYGAMQPLSPERASERLIGIYGRWSIKFSAEYYEQKDREKAARAAGERMLEIDTGSECTTSRPVRRTSS
jgi:hypothetical protein